MISTLANLKAELRKELETLKKNKNIFQNYNSFISISGINNLGIEFDYDGIKTYIDYLTTFPSMSSSDKDC